MFTVQSRKKHLPSRKKIFGLLALVLCATMCFPAFNLYAAETLLDTDYLYLNTVIPSTSEFTLAETAATITLGTPYPIGYTFTHTGDQTVYLTITSTNGLGSQMRLKHLEVNTHIPYSMTFDYDGAGPAGQSPVVNAAQASFGGYDNGYDLQGTFVIVTPAADIYLAGDYQDTITFTFTGL